MNVLKRGWIPLLIVVVVAIAGFTVYRMHGAFGSDNEITRAGTRTQRHLHQACRYRRAENYCTATFIEKIFGCFVVSVKRRRADLVHHEVQFS
jgi:hypothetical protein